MRMLAPLALAALVAVACDGRAPAATAPTGASGPGTGAPPPSTSPASPAVAPASVKVAFLYDSAPEDALDRFLPAQQAAQLAFELASQEGVGAGAPSVELVPHDVAAASVGELSRAVSEDPAYVAVIAAPAIERQRGIANALDVPMVSLSARGAPPREEPGGWLRLVPDLRTQAAVLAARVTTWRASAHGICLADLDRQGSPFTDAVRDAISGGPGAVERVGPEEIASPGCGVVIWGGDAAGAVAALEGVPLDPGTRFVGGASLRDHGFLEEAGEAAEGAFSVCGCADVSTSVELAAQRFIQDYQSEFGRPPGGGSVEAWDAAHSILRGLRVEGASRESLSSWLGGQERLTGLGGTYLVDGGELRNAPAHVHLYRARGGRWVAVQPR